MVPLQGARLGPQETFRPARRAPLAVLALAAFTAGILRTSAATAQELEPRAYSASPIGANFIGVTYAYSSGAILFDPTVPVTDAQARVDALSLGYGRTFGLGRFQALALVGMPYAWGSFSGQVVQRDSSTSRTGSSDIRAKISVNWIGPRALKPADFARAPAHPLVVGTSIAISAPSGQYEPSRLINIGTNRWAFKPELGISYNWRQKWFAECYGGATFFTANTDFYPAHGRREQDPLVSVQGHLSYTITGRTWAALESTWYGGGATRANGGPPGSREDSTRLGGLLAIGLTRSQSVKFAYSYGASVRVGQNFGTFTAGYQWLWF
jgi:hypothetical protein